VTAAELQEGEVGPVGEIEHLEVVVGHLVHVLEIAAVGGQQVERRGRAAGLQHGLQWLPLGQRLEPDGLQPFDAVGGLDYPVGVDLVPVLEVVPDSLGEDGLPLRHRFGVIDDVGAQVQVAVDDPVLDAEGRGQVPHPGRVLVQGDEPALRHHQVERVQRLRVVHLVEEPELLLVPLPQFLAEQQVPRVHRLPALRAGRGLDVERVAERSTALVHVRPSGVS
jgi:hypothetical protein